MWMISIKDKEFGDEQNDSAMKKTKCAWNLLCRSRWRHVCVQLSCLQHAIVLKFEKQWVCRVRERIFRSHNFMQVHSSRTPDKVPEFYDSGVELNWPNERLIASDAEKFLLNGASSAQVVPLDLTKRFCRLCLGRNWNETNYFKTRRKEQESLRCMSHGSRCSWWYGAHITADSTIFSSS